MLNSLKKKTPTLFKNNIFILSIYFFIFYSLTLKTSYISNNLSFLFVLAPILLIILYAYKKENLSFLVYNIFFFIYILNFINSLIIFFMLIELYSLLFYLIILFQIQLKTSKDLLKIKNVLLLYLLGNFLTTSFLLIGIISIIETFGTTSMVELNFFNYFNIPDYLFTIVLAFFIKLALPLVHFLKLEIYKYLSISSVVLFSTLSLVVNYFLITTFLNVQIFIYVLLNYKLIYILLITNIIILSQKLKLSDFNEFIAYSGFASNNLILISFLVKK